ncbi:hypothetical protein GHT09_014765 [Marmota monax]|uniref:Cytochrome P450 n=1 Tax=Marmota monax TaxID=9995 RepID=A0A834QDN6_MARMO|nr:hypothetical protein GHT09_014765 [Marmota monax]
MELSVLLFLALLTGLFLLLVRGRPKARGRLPPGPRPLPFLGNLLQLQRGGLLNSFLRLREKYGDVFTVYLGPKPVVMLCGTEAIREALVDQAEDFSGRGTLAIIEPIFQGYGVTFANGERWKTLRRFSLATMRDFGMGKRSTEERIQEEAQCLVEELRKSKGALLDPTFLFQSITANIICSIAFGERFDYKDREFLRLLDMFYQSSALISSFSSQVFEFFSDVLKHFPGTHRQVYENLQEVLTFIGHSVEKHRATLDPSAPRDFIDAYLLRMDKNTEVYPILSSALHDPHYFEEPDTFNPDHFLDANGALKKNEAFIPFSAGKRICLGEGIARNELFLFFTTILQNFSVASPVAPQDIDLTPRESGVGRVPPTYQICFLPH